MTKRSLLNTILATSAVVLLGASAVGSTSAALTASTNDEITAVFRTAEVSVDLLENGELVTANTRLLANLVGEDETFHVGQRYTENIAFVNDGSYPVYVRAIVTKSWKDEAGKKDQLLDPSLIEVNMPDANWILDEEASTAERKVYYYKTMVAAAEDEEALSPVTVIDSIKINNVIETMVTKENGDKAGNIKTTYNYDGKSFDLDVTVDAIQTHNAVDAAYASWGVYLGLDDNGNITSIAHELEKSDVTENTEDTEAEVKTDEE